MIPYENIIKLRELYNNSLIDKKELLIYLIDKIAKWSDLKNTDTYAEKLIDISRDLGISFIKEAINEGLLDENSVYKGLFRFNKPKDLNSIIQKVERFLNSLVEYEQEIEVFQDRIKVKKYIPEIRRQFHIDEVFEIMDASDTFVEYYVALETSKKSNPAILISPFPIESKIRAEYVVIRPSVDKLKEVFRNCKKEFLTKLYIKLKTKYNIESKLLEQAINENNLSYDTFASELAKFNVYYTVEEDRRFEEAVIKYPQTITELLTKLSETFDPMMVHIYLACAIRIPRLKDLLGHNAIFINFDKSNVGKTILARMFGSEPYYRVTVASLLGFSTGKEIRYSILQNRNDLVVIDELGVEKEAELYGKILELLKNGVATIATGAMSLSTRTWSSIIFNANVTKMISGTLSEKDKARALYSYLTKITDNMQGLASRTSVLNFYQFSMPSTRLDSSVIESIKLLAPSLFTYLGEIYAQVVRKNQELLEEQWTKDNLRKLKNYVDSIEVPEIREFVNGLNENYYKLNVLALRMSIVDAYLEKNIKLLLEDKRYLKDLFFDNKKEIEKLILASLNILAENLEPTDVIIEKIQKLPEEGKILLKIIAEFFRYTPVTESEFTFSYVEDSLREKGIDIKQYTDRTLTTLAQRVIRSKKAKTIFSEFAMIFSKNGFYITSVKIFNNVLDALSKI